MQSFTYIAGKGRYRVFCRVYPLMEGYIAFLMGGTKYHVGAVALGLPRPSLKGDKTSATTSVLAVLGHKDDELARPAAAQMAARLQMPAVVVAGVHIDKAAPAELALLAVNGRRAVAGVIKVLLRRLKNPKPVK
ncbi:hypothetical protein MHOCP_01050 [Moorella humiferrea]|uniref:prenylated flavin chaperone LpdD n=1 Tax=Neomoorella humiferrea TaxID=676965 RepID=UPI0030CEBA23